MTGKQVVIVWIRFDKNLSPVSKLRKLQFKVGPLFYLTWNKKINNQYLRMWFTTFDTKKVGYWKTSSKTHWDVSHSQFCVLLELKTFQDKNNWLQAL